MSRYVGQCNVVRRAGHEKKWQLMIAQAEPVAFDVFLANVDMSPILDEDEAPEEFLRNAVRNDPGTGTFRSVWGTKPCWYLYTAGFEFIFVED